MSKLKVNLMSKLEVKGHTKATQKSLLLNIMDLDTQSLNIFEMRLLLYKAIHCDIK